MPKMPDTDPMPMDAGSVPSSPSYAPTDAPMPDVNDGDHMELDRFDPQSTVHELCEECISLVNQILLLSFRVIVQHCVHCICQRSDKRFRPNHIPCAVKLCIWSILRGSHRKKVPISVRRKQLMAAQFSEFWQIVERKGSKSFGKAVASQNHPNALGHQPERNSTGRK